MTRLLLSIAVLGPLLAGVPAQAQGSGISSAWEHRTADLGDVTLHYVIAGSGPPVVLLHGFPQTWAEWKPVLPALSRRFTVIAPDLRGLGDSSRPTSGYDKATAAGDVRRLLERLGQSSACVVGHDIGGMVAYALARNHPGVVSRLAVLDTPIPGLPGWDRISANPASWHFGFQAEVDLAEAMVRGREEPYVREFIAVRIHNPRAIPEADLRDYAQAYSAPGALRAGFRYYAAFNQDAEANRASAGTPLAMPLLVLTGSESGGQIPIEQLRGVAPQLTAKVLDQTGHWLPEEQPERVAGELAAFCGEGRRAR